LISYEKEVDIDEINNRIKITGIMNNIIRPQETLKYTRINLYNTLALPELLYGRENYARRIVAADEIYKINSRIHLERLYNKQRVCK